MREFTVTMSNRPGQLAVLARRLADAGVNIDALAASSTDHEATVRFVPDDDDATRTVLRAASVVFNERPVLDTVLPNRPGALATLTERLAASGVNIDAMYLMHTSPDGLHFAIAVNDPEGAASTLELS
ncbi:MAG: ACT domain-containing protein [Acidimicrobiia bacterium]|nr:ACT domain-containing protein [Acidimicrobiia bacterium]NNF69580.1 ACT domain-containing protein [Acidimicrobiia bacterium]